MSMGEDMLRDIAMYAQSTVEDCQNIAKEVQEKMKTDIAQKVTGADISGTDGRQRLSDCGTVRR